MSALEQEIIEKFQRLNPDAKLRVRALIEQDIASEFDYEAWLRDVEAIREQIRVDQGGTQPRLDVVDMLRSIRDGEDE